MFVTLEKLYEIKNKSGELSRALEKNINSHQYIYTRVFRIGMGDIYRYTPTG